MDMNKKKMKRITLNDNKGKFLKTILLFLAVVIMFGSSKDSGKRDEEFEIRIISIWTGYLHTSLIMYHIS